ncbi:LTA synthase family protein [Azonexus fungiphilus]|uniref:LTA synthase family protein n=1 Tax=Azonexus fungiphilus TaxID=146940 RepID=UPI00156AA899|nr:LTA synthase family protein [Azonexus fungiphilus]NHC05648.1 LTA synthase family protein [Azonexus fungiphilus]
MPNDPYDIDSSCRLPAQLRFLLWLLGSWLAVFTATRLTLLVASFAQAEATPAAILGIFAGGLVYDLAFLAYAGLALAMLVFLLPQACWGSGPARRVPQLLLFASCFAMLFVALSEWIFWDEFGVRFNFIAVDYLVYSKEVVDNILESYPVWPLLAAIGALALLAAHRLWRPLGQPAALLGWRRRGLLLAAGGGVAALVAATIGQDFPRPSEGNTYQRELAANGPYQFFAAFRNNEIKYGEFYATLPAAEVATLLHGEVAEPLAVFAGSEAQDIRRHIDNPGALRRLNVVLVTIESLSAKYLGVFGDARGLTPNLDRLSRDSLFFTNFYATGTRTDRGLEAITLSLPPTPGRSVVKRIGRESGYASLGRQFRAQGYDPVFLYGGRGYFDNMNAFFSGNGYRIVDQSALPKAEMEFENAWGMSDEDLYRQAVKLADAEHAAGKPFFLQLMTTSNHRPYTYPDGRIDIPSGEGRAGAVKYTDYAIGRFLEAARQKPWFAQTVFVFVADHNAGSAGQQDLPVENYRIPLFIHAPALLEPRRIDRLASQIDIAPTLLGLLGFDYTSTFYGRDMLRDGDWQGRALIGNYQHLGLYDGERLAILSPRRQMRSVDADAAERAVGSDDPLVRRAIAYYQGADHAFRHRLFAWQGG